MNKILITGVTGRLGANLTRQLLDRGYAIKALAMPDDPKRSKLDGLDIEIITGDLRNQELCADLVADVASTGGPSSLSTLLSPLFLRAGGAVVPKLGVPGRPAGGIDCLAQIPGYRTELSAQEVEGDDKIVKISVVGVGMRSHAGIASTMFQALAQESINIQMISTSEIKISVVVDEKYLELGVRALHTAFGLEKSPESST